MLRSTSKLALLFGMLLVLIPGAAVLPGRQNSPPQPNTPFVMIRDLFGAAYPDMFGKDRYVRLCTGHPVDGSWEETYGIDFEVDRFSPGTSFGPHHVNGKPVSPPENINYLKGSLWLDGKSRILRILAEGEAVRTAQNLGIRKLVDSHPEWSEQQVIQALKEAGARYGPSDKDQFLQSIHLQKFEKLLGSFTIASVEVHSTLNETHEGNFTLLLWSVVLNVRSPDGSHQDYHLQFEPFEGRLTAVFAKGTV